MESDLEICIKRRKLDADAIEKNNLPDLYEHHYELIMNEKDDVALDHIKNDELIDLIEDLLKHGSTGFKKHLNDRNQLYEAIKLNKSVKMIKALLKYTSDVNAKSVNGRTPLHMALCRYNLEVVEELLNHECDVNAKDNDGKTPLHYAFVLEHSFGIIQKLKDAGADVNAVDCNSKTPFHYMLEHGYNVEDIQRFLECQQQVITINIEDRQGKTPLHYLSHNNDIKRSIAVLLAEGADINAKAYGGMTPLHYMLKKGFSLDIEEMLFLGADFTAVDDTGKSALHFALCGNNVEVVRELLNSDEVDVNIKDKDGNTPLHYAASKKKCGKKCIQEILNFGGDVNAKNGKGKYPLSLALKKSRSKEIVTLMLNHGASVHDRGNSYRSVEEEDIFQELIKYSLLEHMSCDDCMIWYEYFFENGINYIKECKEELGRMKEVIICEQNLYDLVRQKCDYGKRVKITLDHILYLKNNQQRLTKEFPIYHDVVMGRLETKTYLLGKFDDLPFFVAINQHKIININSYCVKTIASYLQVAHLNNFYEAICNK